MKMTFAIFVCSLAVLLCPPPVFPHHSFSAEYDSAKPITIQGVVARVEFVNPHSWLYLDVTEGGKSVRWRIEMASPAALARGGVKRNTMPPGTKLTVDGYRVKGGSNVVNGDKIRLPDGTVLSAASPYPSLPASPGATTPKGH